MYYLQFLPHRVIFINTIIALGSAFLLQNSRKNTDTGLNILKTLGFLFASIGIVWNFESGMIALLGWTLFLIYLELIKIRKKTSSYKNILPLSLAPIICVIGVIGLIQIITYTKSGSFLNLEQCFFFQSLFYKNGFYMLRMPLFTHPWMLFVLVYAIGIIKALNTLFFSELISRKAELKGALYFLLSVIGIGIFVYYQGRSHIMVLNGVIFPAVILLALFCSEFYENWRNEKNQVLERKSACTKFVLIYILATIFAVSALDELFVKNLASQTNKLKANKGNTMKSIELIKNNIPSDKEPDIITLDSGILYTMLGRKDNLKLNPMTDLVTKKQYEKLFEYLEKSSNPLIIDECLYFRLRSYENKKLQKLLKKKKYRLKNMSNNSFNDIFIYEQ